MYGDYAASSRRMRGSSQRLFLLEEEYTPKRMKTTILSTSASVDSISTLDYFHYAVQGTTNNIYNISFISNGKWTCTCPDYKTRSTACKHIYFIQDRVLSAGTRSLWNKATDRISKKTKNTTPEEKEILAQPEIIEYYKKRKATIPIEKGNESFF